MTRGPGERLANSLEMQVNFEPLVFVSNAAAAFGLNVSVFLLVGSTSALTMNVAGVLKDWLLIGLSVTIFKAQARAACPNVDLYHC